MLGATETIMGPEVAPVGIVMLIDVLFQVLIVTGIPLKITALVLCDAPNPEPEMITWLPTGPVVVERLVITGAGDPDPGKLTDTLSNVAVAMLELDPLLTPRPIYTFCAMVTVWLDPLCAQFTPSGE
jgi:hypothetical protein